KGRLFEMISDVTNKAWYATHLSPIVYPVSSTPFGDESVLHRRCGRSCFQSNAKVVGLVHGLARELHVAFARASMPHRSRHASDHQRRRSPAAACCVITPDDGHPAIMERGESMLKTHAITMTRVRPGGHA